MNENAIYTTSLFSKVCSDILLKCAFSLTYIIYSFAFDTLKGEALIALMGLIIFDFVTALYAVKKTGEKIKSGRIFRTPVKIVLYYLMISAGHFVELVIPQLSFMVDETILGFLALTEIISIFENVGKLGYEVPTNLLDKLKSLKKKK
jgi:toxin secretion/phage lysis holin